jgi:hypothetical protein
MDQWVSKESANQERSISCAEKENALARFAACNGVYKVGPVQRAAVRDWINRPALASTLTAVIDRDGVVLAVIAGRSEARAFLRGGCA